MMLLLGWLEIALDSELFLASWKSLRSVGNGFVGFVIYLISSIKFNVWSCSFVIGGGIRNGDVDDRAGVVVDAVVAR